jgi:hypothetical protein
MSNTRPLDERIETAREEVRQKENRLKLLLQQQKSQERKDRNHRLCERGGYLESILPDTVPLSLEQFKTYLNKTLMTDFANKILHGLAADNSIADTAEPGSEIATTEATEAKQITATSASAGLTAATRQAG